MTTVQELKEKWAKDPKKKAALDRAKATIEKWREEGTLHDRIQLSLVEFHLDEDGEIKED